MNNEHYMYRTQETPLLQHKHYRNGQRDVYT